MRLHPVHRYVGPPEIAAAAVGAPRGLEVRSPDELARVVRALGSARIFTFVVDGAGVLRVAPRASEHVACAGGGVVLAAGELFVARDQRGVTDATNLSTGYCPRPECLDGALVDALDRAGIARPSAFTTYDMRRCAGCRARVVIKDGDFACPECDGALPAAWNFERARVSRGFAAGWVVDVFVEAGTHDEDRVRVEVDADRATVVLADGAGNSGRGARAADAAIAPATDTPRDRLARLDGALAVMGAEAAVVAIDVHMTDVLTIDAAAAGDARLWARSGGEWRELTEGVPRKPLVGSGAVPSVRRARGDALLCASDGLVAWPGPELDASLLAHDDAVFRLADAVRMRSGALADDLSIVWMRRAT